MQLDPPQSEPNITVWAHKNICTDSGDPHIMVGPGTALKCEGTGGRPPVSKVILACDSPTHPDPKLPDEAGPKSAVSYVTMTNPQDKDGNITCTCVAPWTHLGHNIAKSSSKIFDILGKNC